MPGGDGTGPLGAGPMTGRAAGFCAGYTMPGYTNYAGGRGWFGWGRGFGGGWSRGRGRGFGFGRGRGWGGWFGGVAPYAAPYTAAPYTAAPTQEQEVEMLKNQASYFEEALNGIRQRIDELKTKMDNQ